MVDAQPKDRWLSVRLFENNRAPPQNRLRIKLHDTDDLTTEQILDELEDYINNQFLKNY